MRVSKRLVALMARRYLFSRKEKTVINLISWISLAGIAISTLAMVVVMSVYNGIGELTQTLFNVFDPELMIKPVEGKTFHTSDINYTAIAETQGVKAVCPIVEENAWITRRQAESIVMLRGIDSTYGLYSGLDTLITEGEYLLKDIDAIRTTSLETDEPIEINYLLMGWNVMMKLGVNSMTNTPLAVHIPKRGNSAIGLTIDEAFNNGYAYPAGAFRIQEEIDNMYVVANIDFVRRLMSYSPDEVTALAITLDDSRQLPKVKQQLRETLGESFTVSDRLDQKPLYYKIFRSERLGVFLILSLIVLIATLNLIASLSLLIINKRKDIATLKALGMSAGDIRKVFFTEGVLIAAVGVVAGLVLGFFTCLLQQRFGIVKLGANAVVEAFPIAMRWVDFLAAFLVVSFLSALVVAFTVRRAKI